MSDTFITGGTLPGNTTEATTSTSIPLKTPYINTEEGGKEEIGFYTPAEAVYFESKDNTLAQKIQSMQQSSAGIAAITAKYASSNYDDITELRNYLGNSDDEIVQNSSWRELVPKLSAMSGKYLWKLTEFWKDAEKSERISYHIDFIGSLGESGAAGVNIEWVYRRVVSESELSVIKEELKESEKSNQYSTAGMTPKGWSQNLPEATTELPIIYASKRTNCNDGKGWSTWSEPTIVYRIFTEQQLDDKYLSKKDDDTAAGHITFNAGITVSDKTNEEAESEPILEVKDGRLNVLKDAYFQNITVAGKAQFATLVLDEIKAIGGTQIISTANPFTVVAIEEIKEGETTTGYKLYWEVDSKDTLNTWGKNDLAICAQWNGAKVGTSQGASSTYYWTTVTEASEEVVQKEINGKDTSCHYIVISAEGKGDVKPEVGHNIAQLGNTSAEDRQSAIVLASSNWIDANVYTPAFVQYTLIDSFNLEGKIKNKIDRKGTTLSGKFQSATGETFVTKDDIAKEIESTITQKADEIGLITQSDAEKAGLIITLEKDADGNPTQGKITLEADKTIIEGDLNIAGLVTDSIQRIDFSEESSYKDSLVCIDMDKIKSVEVSPEKAASSPMVILPMYNEVSIEDLSIPAYKKSGTHLIIRNPFNPEYSLWSYQALGEGGKIVKFNEAWENALFKDTILHQIVVICADPRILRKDNYFAETECDVNPCTMVGKDNQYDQAGGVYLNGRRGRFIFLLPGQQVELTSIVSTDSAANKYLTWYITGTDLDCLTQTITFYDAEDNNSINFLAEYASWPSKSIWGYDPNAYLDTIFGYSQIDNDEAPTTCILQWSENYPYMTIEAKK